MKDETIMDRETAYDAERLSLELERDARRYNKAFTEEEEVRLA